MGIFEIGRFQTGAVADFDAFALGYSVFTMTGHGMIKGASCYMTQTLALVGEKVYKAMAFGIDADTRVDPDAADFIGSFKILAPKKAAADLPILANPQSQQTPSDNAVARFSQTAGGVAGLLLIIAGILYVVRRTGARSHK